ncbi:MAG TPA: calcium-binding protein [Allosphingosinicella sp.]|nr:calcium-binding protein [Allosphingosinicella sp.]
MPQTPLTPQITVNTTGPGAQWAPAIARLPDGGYIIIWGDFNAGAIFGQRYSAAGAPVGAQIPLNSFAGGAPIWLSATATANGGFVLTWQAGGFASADIHAQYYTAAGASIGVEFKVNTTIPNEQFNPHVTQLSNGNLLFTWDTTAFDVLQEVRGRIYTPTGESVGPGDFVVKAMSAESDQGASSIAPLANGGFVVVWRQAAPAGSGNFEIVGQRFDSLGNKSGGEFQANTQITNSQYGADVAQLSDGSFVVTWTDPVPSNGGGRVVARHYTAAGVPIGGEILVASKAAGSYGQTVVTALANGGYVVSWTEDNVSGGDPVMARAFGSNDVALDAAFEIATSTLSSNYYSDGAITLTNGNVVFAWDGPSAAGSGLGSEVYMRVYSFSGGTGPTPITGTTGPDALTGTAGADVIQGLGGNDTLDGRGGADRLEGGAGDDAYLVDNAGDVVVELAGEGNDRVYAGAGYALAAGASVETLSTDFNAGTAAINLTGNELANALIGNAGANVLSGGAGNDVLDGKEGNDSLYGGADHDSLYGGQGNDLLSGGAGANYLAGGAGDDQYVVASGGDHIEEAAGEGNDRVYAGVSYTLAAAASVETLSTDLNAGTASINLTGNGLANNIIGNAGANLLNGAAGNDILDGKEGNDTLYGGADNDNLYGREGNDLLHGGAGANYLAGGQGDDQYVVESAGDFIEEAAGQGNDRLYASLSFALALGASVETMSTADNAGTAAINLTGNELANNIIGNAGANVLNGAAGNDVLDGKEGNDILHGGLGDDSLYGGTGNDQLHGGAGTNYLAGGIGDDLYVVDNAANAIAEAAGQGNDRVYAAASYTLALGVSVEILSTSDNAGTASIGLTGNELANTLFGNAGANVLDGGAGGDFLEGKGGADSYVFTTALGPNNVDTIAGFQSGVDRIWLDNAVFTALGASGALSPNAFVTGNAAADGTDRIVYNNATGQLFYDADGAGGAAAILFATLQGAPALTATDFLVI